MTRSQQTQHEADIKPILTQDTQPQTGWEPIQITFLLPLSNKDYLTSYTSNNSLQTTFGGCRINE